MSQSNCFQNKAIALCIFHTGKLQNLDQYEMLWDTVNIIL